MIKRALLLAVAVCLTTLILEGNAARSATPDFAPGQEWSIKSVSPTTAKVIIGQVEPWRGKVVVQVSVIDVPIPSSAPGAGGMTIINHMPFEKSALAASVDQLVATDVSPPPNFESGYEKWRSDKKAGIYTIGVAQAIELLFATLSHGHG